VLIRDMRLVETCMRAEPFNCGPYVSGPVSFSREGIVQNLGVGLVENKVGPEFTRSDQAASHSLGKRGLHGSHGRS
jgi:hypothetical protein